ncbi:hypothetical protein HBH56_135050 [Parastagonospora nodorum]|uniref:Uncharacterized protein n=1 Tax=Phaeosphaeria nodorum (strain SN15 / ATCC MYA-4574 / FGSC 10173) TaxID=321614 RepID=A0A7U2FCA6_PHANO|nr:hypothetical protein HBH56_135050 [Parastagonospora nodorum]QRD02618.1 hypothetical protein JI435_418260 [Parastagonospora nodorum SN15]KAH3926872.1 hypothetical protein HBH54_158240 [Parastagonospora nodorum]KAH3958778.1 hypothetical protein HBH51_205260 [Parastagonospora nodorum]KAH4066728.1 hypothetical protein HBH50_142250 [Parastagonospora nodorum]
MQEPKRAGVEEYKLGLRRFCRCLETSLWSLRMNVAREGKTKRTARACRTPPNDEPLLMKVDEIDCVLWQSLAIGAAVV